MLKGAVDTLMLGGPWYLSTDCGPVIDAAAYRGIAEHIATARAEGRVIKELSIPDTGTFIGPTLIELPGIAALQRFAFFLSQEASQFAYYWGEL